MKKQIGFLAIMLLAGFDGVVAQRPGARRPRWASRVERPPIEDLLQPGQEVMVQISKEAMGSKGARITTQLAVPIS